MSTRRNLNVRVLALCAVGAVMASALGVASALAAPPQAATFSVIEQFDPESGEFTSDGSILCASGTTSNEFFPSGFQSNTGIVFHDRKTITCDDGSGTFTLLVEARTGFNVGDDGTVGRWVVLSGTGDYVGLHGQGTLTGTYFPNGLSEVYEGRLAYR